MVAKVNKSDLKAIFAKLLIFSIKKCLQTNIIAGKSNQLVGRGRLLTLRSTTTVFPLFPIWMILV